MLGTICFDIYETVTEKWQSCLKFFLFSCLISIHLCPLCLLYFFSSDNCIPWWGTGEGKTPNTFRFRCKTKKNKKNPTLFCRIWQGTAIFSLPFCLYGNVQFQANMCARVCVLQTAICQSWTGHKDPQIAVLVSALSKVLYFPRWVYIWLLRSW